jgi:hypothetical protein
VNVRTRNPWDEAKKRRVVRGYRGYAPADLEPGVKFFVLMLEKVGCRTFFSCEGHPGGFYIVFGAALKLAQQIEGCGYFTVALSRLEHLPPTRGAYWRLSLQGNETSKYSTGHAWTVRERNACLRGAAERWVEAFGELGSP